MKFEKEADAMDAELKWLDMPDIFSVGRVPAHSDHTVYADPEEYRKGRSSLTWSLNGVWKFCYSPNAQTRPADFYQPGYDLSGFDEITVPGHIEMAGYDGIHYINTMYPWEGKEFRRPPVNGNPGKPEGMFSRAEYNPVGSYIREFDLPEAMRGKRVTVYFEGIEQAFYVWLNGEFLGYAEDSFTPSEFDLTPYIKDQGNLLAVEVHKRSTAAFLEDQDFFRFFGIFRNVSLHAQPQIHLEDMWLRAVPQLHEPRGTVSLAMKFSTASDPAGAKSKENQETGYVKLRVVDGEKILAEGKQEIVFRESGNRRDISSPDGGNMQEQQWTCGIEDIRLWDNHDPYLYELQIEVYGSDGTLLEYIPWRFGFRKIELTAGSGADTKVMYLNGKRLVINGVNRHEWSAVSGRCITEKEEAWDMGCLKQNNINAVRTCHYPDRLSWYSLCDENGIYVMAETNLETHGSWQKLGRVEPSWNVPGSDEKWTAAVMDRARSNFETLKNHTSILFWSLGNESYAGEAFCQMNEYFRKDPDRLTHYEGVFHTPAYRSLVSDVESRMYASPQDVRAYLDNAPDKPFILCEYMHDMGNSLGGLKDYMELIDEYEMYQGGFIWDFIDQAVQVEDDVTGRKVLRYGGDFDDRPSDYEFSGNGIVFADRQEKPAMQEVRYYYGKYK